MPFSTSLFKNQSPKTLSNFSISPGDTLQLVLHGLDTSYQNAVVTFSCKVGSLNSDLTAIPNSLPNFPSTSSLSITLPSSFTNSQYTIELVPTQTSALALNTTYALELEFLLTTSKKESWQFIFKTGQDIVGNTTPGTPGVNNRRNLGNFAVAPATAVQGDSYYNTTLSKYYERINGAWVEFGTDGGSSGVSSFNARTGAVTLTAGDVLSAVGDGFVIDDNYIPNSIARDSEILTKTLDGFNAVDSVVSATDTVISGFGKLQGQVNNKQNTLTNPVTGIGASSRIAVWSGANSQTSFSGLTFNNSLFSVTGQSNITNNVTSSVVSTIQGVSGQTANLSEWKNPAGVVMSAITPTGGLSIQSNTVTGRFLFDSTPSDPGTGYFWVGASSNSPSTGNYTLAAVDSGFLSYTIFNCPSYGKMFFRQNNGTYFGIANGRIVVSTDGLLNTNTGDANSRLSIYTDGATKKALTIHLSASPTANAFEIQSSTASLLYSIEGNGSITVNNGARISCQSGFQGLVFESSNVVIAQSVIQFSNSPSFDNGINITLGTGAGTKIGTATNQKLGFFNATPVAQQTGGVATASASYTATEQQMLQRVYDALRTFGFLS